MSLNLPIHLLPKANQETNYRIIVYHRLIKTEKETDFLKAHKKIPKFIIHDDTIN